ncbi:hypothetical protein HYE67_004365 [Fusarium culmorum]|uniref:Methyltransferase domain-containing protein n=1 Tax=Fusarium culmorum TaxID=5516 RepID=A0A7S8D504_FUSCU|nr:hypothetical protein HYE67_004365 [Fusarium culmorum]
MSEHAAVQPLHLKWNISNTPPWSKHRLAIEVSNPMSECRQEAEKPALYRFAQMPAAPSRLPHWTLVFVPMINGTNGTPMLSGPKVNSENNGSRIVEHCGRTYQHYSLKNDTYFAPIDEVEAKTLPMSQSSAESNISCQDEISRLEVMHGVLSGLFDRRLIFPPIRSPRRVLDCGCGTGDWAMEVATQYPDSEGEKFGVVFTPTSNCRELACVLPLFLPPRNTRWRLISQDMNSVLGIDISPHMIPENPPDNMELQVDDLNGRFTFKPNHFDLVHSQMLAGGIHANRWGSYIRDIFRVLKPGGWCQMVEIYFNAQSDNGTLTPVVKTISGKPRTTPRPAGTIANGELDEKCGLHRSRIETHDITDVRLVEQYDGIMFYPCVSKLIDEQFPEITRLLSSLALYPFTQMLGYVNRSLLMGIVSLNLG